MYRKTLVVAAILSLAVTGVASAVTAFNQVGAWPYGPARAVGVDVGRHLIFLSSGGAVLILDGTDPANPTLVDDEIRTRGLVKDIAYDPATQRLFMACGSQGLEIWDVQNPTAPAFLSQTVEFFGFGVSDANTVVVWEHFAAIGDFGVFVVDVTDPLNPVATGGGVGSERVADLYVSPEDGKLHATDSLYYTRFTVTAAGQLDADGSIYVSDAFGTDSYGAGTVAANDRVACFEHHGPGFVQEDIVDMTAAGFPTLATLHLGFLDDMAFDGDMLYIANTNGLSVYDLQNPSSPDLVGTMSLPNSPKHLAVAQGYLYLADRGYADVAGLETIELGDGSAPHIVGSYTTYQPSLETRLVGDYAFVAASFDGLNVIDLSDMEHPERVAQIDGDGRASDLAIEGDTLYLAADADGLRIIDISDPTSPAVLGDDTDLPNAWRVAAVGARAYVLDNPPGNQHKTLHVLDVTNPGAPVELGGFELPTEFASAILSDGQYAYVAADQSGVLVLDVSNPEQQITQVATIDTHGAYAADVAREGNLLYVGSIVGPDGLYVEDVSDPTNPQELGHLYHSAGSFDLDVGGGFVVSSGLYNLGLISVDDPTSPVFVGDFRTPDAPQGLVARDQYVFTSDGDAGLQIYENMFFGTPGTSWEQLASPVSSALRGVDFTDSVHGWAVGEYGAILSTTDGGDSWAVHAGITSHALWCVTFLDQQTGWICGDDGLVLATADGGTTWVVQPTPTSLRLRVITFVDQQHGWAVGGDTLSGIGVLLHTEDGGASWQMQDIGASDALYNVEFIDLLHGWAVGRNGQALHTTDGGMHWIPGVIPGDDSGFGLDFFDEDHGWLTTGTGKIFESTDGGQSWQLRFDSDPNFYQYLHDIQFVDATHAWSVGSSAASGHGVRTNDGGSSWQEMIGNGDWSLEAVDFVDTQHGWAVGLDGTILRAVGRSTITGAQDGLHPVTPPTSTPLVILQGANPNPFNPITDISFTLTHDARVKLRVYDVAGRRVADLADGDMSAGLHQVRFAPRTLASGTYLLRLDADGEVQTSKLMLVR